MEPMFRLYFRVLGDGIETSGPTSFPRFGNLPAELRLKIWGYLLRPRIVMVACAECRPGRGDGDEKGDDNMLAPLRRRPRQPAVPVLLHINRETRDLALRHYELAFAWKMPSTLSLISYAPAYRPSSEARVWFDFAHDTLLLLNELEPSDQYGFPSPMVYFLSRADTARVRHVACAFEALRYGEAEAEAIFGCLFHIVDRFPAAGRLLVTSTDADVATGIARGQDRPGLGPRAAADNVLSNIWRGWISGRSVVTSSLADTQILIVREDELEGFIADHS